MAAYEQTAYNQFGNIFAHPISSYQDIVDRQDILVTTAQEVFGALVRNALNVPEATVRREPDPQGPIHLYLEGGPGKVAAIGYNTDAADRPQKLVTSYTTWSNASGRYGVVHNEYEADEQRLVARISTSLILLKEVVPFNQLCDIPDEQAVRTRYEVVRRNGATEVTNKPATHAGSSYRISRLPHEPRDMYHILNNRLCAPIVSMAHYAGFDG